MKRWWRPDSLREKLLAVAGVATVAALLCALAVNLVANVITFHNRTAAEMEGQAELVGRMTAPALEFGDHDLAAANLALFDTRPGVRAAAIYDEQDRLFATYAVDGQSAQFPEVPPEAGARLRGTELWVSHPIRRDGVVLGRVFLRVHHDLAGVVAGGVLVALVVGAFAILLAYLLISRLARHVTAPIADVARTARGVVSRQDYSRRVAKTTDDEVGELVEAFNAMLEEIERRTRDLEQSYAHASLEARERERAQQEVMRLNASLEQRVEARTADLREANTELTRAKAAADEANSAKSAFLATMSHEIRTPMNGVIGMVDVLHQTSLNGHQVEMVDLIRESAFSLLNVIDDILDFSRIESGRLELEQAPVDLGELAEGVCVMLDHYALKKDVQLLVTVDPAVPARLLGDALRLRQVLANLVSNAIKFSSGNERPGCVCVRMELVGSDAQRARVVMRVVDNGIGIDEQAVARLFTPFSQADTSTTRRFGGSGLGLAITRNLVEMMGGQVSVHSAPGEGSTFTVELELAIVPGAAATLERPLAGTGCIVIGAEDSLAPSFVATLEAAGAQVACVANGAQARDYMAVVPAGPWAWVADAGADSGALAKLERAVGGTEAKLVVVGRGALREPRLESSGAVRVDGNALPRRKLVQAVALAFGRAEQASDAATGRGRGAFDAPSRAQALQAGRLVLVAEDNETNQQVIVRQLGLLGFAADVARNGLQALSRWRGGGHALLLTDLHMPEMDGYQLARAIRSGERGTQRRMPIVALTANALKGEAERCRAAGMDGYLSKPLQLADLQAMLEARLPGSTSPLYRRANVRGSGQPVDPGVLQELVGDDPAVLHEFLQGFQVSAAGIVQALVEACAAGDIAGAVAQAHKLKSSARTVGALALGDLCERIEAAGKAGDDEALGRLLPAFERESAMVAAWLAAIPPLAGEEAHG